jgi:TolA-binding protein
MMRLGALHEEQGEVEEAEARYQQAIDSGHPDRAPEAMMRLGPCLRPEAEAAAERDRE